jgi:hypothetical protein
LTQLFIAVASPIEEGRAPVRVELQGCVIDLIDLFPSLGRHKDE